MMVTFADVEFQAVYPTVTIPRKCLALEVVSQEARARHSKRIRATMDAVSMAGLASVAEDLPRMKAVRKRLSRQLRRRRSPEVALALACAEARIAGASAHEVCLALNRESAVDALAREIVGRLRAELGLDATS